MGRGLGVQALGVPPRLGQEKPEWAVPGPPAGWVPLSFKETRSLIPPLLLHQHPLSGQEGDGTGSTTHGLALLAWISTEALYTLLPLEVKERQVKGLILEAVGARANSSLEDPKEALVLPSHVALFP